MYLKDLKRKLALCLAVFTFFSAMPVDMQRAYGAERKAMSTEQAAVNVNGNDLASSRGTIAAEKSTVKSQADEGWWEDYTYYCHYNNRVLVLEHYTGNATDLTVPATATIDGTTYKTELGDQCFYYNRELTSISFEPGVRAHDTQMRMFSWCINLSSLDLSNLDTSNVTDMSFMFQGCSNLSSLDLSNLDTSNVTDMANMFSYCSNLSSLDLSNLDTSNVTDMSAMFSGCSNLSSLDLSNLDTSNVTNMAHMFSGCRNLSSLDLSSFDTSNVTNMGLMFYDCSNLSSLDLSSFDTGNVTDMGDMFGWCSNLSSLDLSNLDTSNVTNMIHMFYECGNLSSLNLSSFDTSNVTDMNWMFCECGNLSSLDLSSFDTGNVTDMSSMFSGCRNLSSLDLSSFDTSNVTNMGHMFYDCSNLSSLDISSFDTGNVTDMGDMFGSCSNLSSLDLSSFDTGNVTDMGGMFEGCSNLSSLDLSSFDTSNVTKMGMMFNDCSNLSSLDLSNFDTSNVTLMHDMFDHCRSLTYLDLSNFDMGRVNSGVGMFFDCSNLQVVYYPKTNGLSLAGVNTLTNVYIPDTVTHLETYMIPKRSVIYNNSASDGITTQASVGENTVIHANEGSYGAKFADDNGYPRKDYDNRATGDTTGNNSLYANYRYIAVYDYYSRMPVSGAKLYSEKNDALIGTSDEAGYIDVSAMKDMEQYIIRLDPYEDYPGTITYSKQTYCIYLKDAHEYLKCANLMDTLDFNPKKFVKNMLTERATISCNCTYYINLKTSDEVKQVSLISGGRIIGTSEEGTITFNSADINNYDTVLSLFGEGGRLLRSYPLNINVSSLKNDSIDTISLGGMIFP